MEEEESERTIQEGSVGGLKIKEEKPKADLHLSSEFQPWEILTDKEAQDFLRSSIIREFEKTVPIDDISVKEPFAKFLNTNGTCGASIQKEQTKEETSNLNTTTPTSNDIDGQKSEDDYQGKTQNSVDEIGANNNKNQHNEDNESRKKQNEQTVAEGDKNVSTDKNMGDSKDESKDQSQTNCNTMDVDEEKNS